MFTILGHEIPVTSLGNRWKCFQTSSKLTQFTSQAKVDDLDPRPGRVHADDVLRFEVQVDDVLLVNVLHALQDLLHVAGAGGLCVLKVVVHDAFKELPACNAGQRNYHSQVPRFKNNP